MSRSSVSRGNHLIPVPSPALLLFLMVILLLVAGCESQTPAAAEPSGSIPTIIQPARSQPQVITISPAATLSEERTPVSEVVKDQPAPGSADLVIESASHHPEYIKMDAISYAAGEVVQFYLVNKGSEIKGCDYSHPAYTIYHLSPDGTRMTVSGNDPGRSYFTVISGGDPGSVTGPFSLDTRKMTPGRYLIRFDCGNNVAREFMLMARP